MQKKFPTRNLLSYTLATQSVLQVGQVFQIQHQTRRNLLGFRFRSEVSGNHASNHATAQTNQSLDWQKA